MNINEETGFLQALVQNEDDTTTRLIYADWLDERGEHEEANRQREWTASKAWLVDFCEQYNTKDQDFYNRIIPYQELLQLGLEAIIEVGELGFFCGDNESMSYALNCNKEVFWKHFSIVTGTPLPEDEDIKRSHFSCSC